MTKPINQECPLCGMPAHYFPEDYENRKHFFCDNCTEFELSRYAEEVIAKSAGTWQAAASKAAREAPTGTFYRLTRPLSDQTGIPMTADLVGSYVKRKS